MTASCGERYVRDPETKQLRDERNVFVVHVV